MNIVKLFYLFTLCIFSSKAIAGIGEFITNHYESYRYSDYAITTNESYDFSACQEFASENTDVYYIGCVENNLSQETEFDNLASNLGRIERDVLEESLLLDIKGEVLSELNRNQSILRSVQRCIDQPTSSNECASQIEHMLSTVKTQLPQVRALMAQKNTPGNIYSETIPDRFQKENLSHAINRERVSDLTENEITFLRGHTRQLERDFTQAVYRGEIDFPIDNLDSCLDRSNPLEINLSENRECQRFELITQIRVNRLFDKQNKVYEQEYQRMISQNPMLSLLHVTSEDSDQEILSDIQRAISKLLQEGTRAVSHIENLEGNDRRELFAFSSAVENYFENQGASRYLCDLAQDQKESYDFSNLRTDIYIGAGALVGGGVCFFTAGLGCAVTVAVGAEVLAIGVSQNRFRNAQNQFYSGLVDSQTMSDREFDRNLSLYLAPLALVGHGGVSAGRTLSRRVSRELANDSSTGIRTNTVQRESLEELERFLGDNRTLMLTRYYDGAASDLANADQIHFAGIAELLERRFMSESPNISRVQLEQNVKRQIDEIMNRCR